MLERKTRTRLHIRSISDPSQKADSEIAELFREMRQASGQSLKQLAEQFKTPQQTLIALEQGQLSFLPPWNESSRVVFEYANMLGLDPEPVLRRIMVQLPNDHPKRPRTQSHEPSFENMRSNVSAVMNRVPGTQPDSRPEPDSGATPKAALSQPRKGAQNHQFTSASLDLRAIASDAGAANAQSPPLLVANKRKSGIFVLLLQFLLLLILLGAGYAMWLSIHDPQGFEALKSLTVTSWDTLAMQIRVWFKI